MATETIVQTRTFNFCFLDLNTASEEEISSIPLVGAAHAHQLVEHRPFRSMDEVKQVPGILQEQIDALLQAGAVISAYEKGSADYGRTS